MKGPTNKGLAMEQCTARSCMRSLIALSLREDGKLFREIGDHFSVSPSRAREMVGKGKRLMNHPSRANLNLGDVIDYYTRKFDLGVGKKEKETIKGNKAMTGWQPIETAPRDGTEFLAVELLKDSEGRFTVWLTGYWHEGWCEFHYGTADESHRDSDFHPTHWMPLPEPPCAPEKTLA